MADERSGLWGEVKRILAACRPDWFLGENVPGILSVNGGLDWLAVLRDLAELGYGTAYRVLDAQWFGVAQRRRRVFIVGCLGDWRRAAEVLFERESLPWDSAPSREAGARIASSLTRGTDSSGKGGYAGRRQEDDVNIVVNCLDRHMGSVGVDDNAAQANHLIHCQTVAPTLNAHFGDKQGLEDQHVRRGCGHFVAYQCHGSNVGPMGHLRSGNGNETGGVPFVFQSRVADNGRGQPSDVAYAITDHGSGGQTDRRPQCVDANMAVRRLTPRECERLQGFPDDWTRWGHDGKEISDSARYRMCGNAVAVPVVEWIGHRIMESYRDVGRHDDGV